MKLISLKLIVASLLCTFSKPVAAQPPVFRMQSYIETYSLEAVHQMITYKIPASVILAQAIFESQSGNSELARKSNNHFGIKCHREWGGETVLKDDDTLNECFRKYDEIEDSYTDHSLFLISRARYASLFDLPLNDYKAWCYGLKQAGYATYSAYADELIKLIEKTKLYELDEAVLLEITGPESFVKAPEADRSYFRPDMIPLANFSKSGGLWEKEGDLFIKINGAAKENSSTNTVQLTDHYTAFPNTWFIKNWPGQLSILLPSVPFNRQ